MPEFLKGIGEKSEAVLWGVAFTGVCVLVGLGKIKAETVEYLLFALVGRSATKRAPEASLPKEG